MRRGVLGRRDGEERLVVVFEERTPKPEARAGQIDLIRADRARPRAERRGRVLLRAGAAQDLERQDQRCARRVSDGTLDK